MLDFNLESDDEIETVSVMVVDEAGNPVPVTTESGFQCRMSLLAGTRGRHHRHRWSDWWRGRGNS